MLPLAQPTTGMASFEILKLRLCLCFWCRSLDLPPSALHEVRSSLDIRQSIKQAIDRLIDLSIYLSIYGSIDRSIYLSIHPFFLSLTLSLSARVLGHDEWMKTQPCSKMQSIPFFSASRYIKRMRQNKWFLR